MPEQPKSDELAPAVSTGLAGCGIGCVALPIFTLIICSIFARQIFDLGRPEWVAMLAGLYGAGLGFGTGYTIVKQKEDRNKAGSVSSACGLYVVVWSLIHAFKPRTDVPATSIQPEHLSLHTILTMDSLAIIWGLLLVGWGSNLMWKSKQNKVD